MPTEPADGEIHIQPVRGNLYMLVGDGGNIVVQVGNEGAFVVDTGTGARADKTLAAIRTLSDKPIQFIATPVSFPIERVATRRYARPGRTRVFAGRSSRCSSAMPASAPRSWRIRTCRTG